MNEKIKYWINISEYDIETAKAMLDSKRLLYVGFMCHQAIEKILKAYYVFSKNENPPYTHSLSVIAKDSGLFVKFNNEQLELIDTLEPLNVMSRYPDVKDRLFASLTVEKCKRLLEETEELFKWIKQKLLI